MSERKNCPSRLPYKEVENSILAPTGCRVSCHAAQRHIGSGFLADSPLHKFQVTAHVMVDTCFGGPLDSLLLVDTFCSGNSHQATVQLTALLDQHRNGVMFEFCHICTPISKAPALRP